MAYSTLYPNQGVNFNDLQDAVNNGLFKATGTAIPVSTQIIQKSQVATYVYIDTSNPFYAAKPVNENIDKQDLTTLYPVNLVFDFTTALNETVTAIDINGVTPTIVLGLGVPFSTDTHLYNTTQIGSNQTLTLAVTWSIAGQRIRLVDSNGTPQCINLSSPTVVFTNVAIDNVTAVSIYGEDGVC